MYQPDENVELEVRLEEERVWLTQAQMALLFGCSPDNIGLHLKNIYEEKEIDTISTSEKISVVRKEGNRYVSRRVLHYNLDAILSVGYRVSSANATKFRQWANKVLKDYLLKGYAINQRLTKIENQLENQQALLAEHSEKIDLGRKWFAFSKMEINSTTLLSKM